MNRPDASPISGRRRNPCSVVLNGNGPGGMSELSASLEDGIHLTAFFGCHLKISRVGKSLKRGIACRSVALQPEQEFEKQGGHIERQGTGAIHISQ